MSCFELLSHIFLKNTEKTKGQIFLTPFPSFFTACNVSSKVRVLRVSLHMEGTLMHSLLPRVLYLSLKGALYAVIFCFSFMDAARGF